MGETRGTYGGGEKFVQTFGGKPEVKRPLKRPRPKGEQNIKINVKEVGLQGVDCIRLDQDTDKWQALAKAAKSLRVPYKGEKFLDQLRNLIDKKDPAP